MYLLEVNHGGGEVHHYFLLPGESYEVGRKECRLLLPANEPSISRHHATIVVSPLQTASVFDPKKQLDVCIQDFSKHGTFVDRERIGKDNSRFIYPEDRIRFGIKVTARIMPMTLVLTVSPDTSNEFLEEVVQCAAQLGAYVSEECVPSPGEYYDKHTNCLGFLYVAPEKFSMDQSMMVALGYGYTLVTIGYLNSLLKDLKSNDTLMPSEFPPPLPPTPSSLALRNVHYRRPVQTFYSVVEFLSVGSPASSTVFSNYRFLLIDEAIISVYQEVIELFKGTVSVIQPADVKHQEVSTDKKEVVVLSEADFNAVSDVILCNSEVDGSSSPLIQHYVTLYKKYYCLVPEENIHLSLYRDDPKEICEKSNACYLRCLPESEGGEPAPTVPEVKKTSSNLPERSRSDVRRTEPKDPSVKEASPDIQPVSRDASEAHNTQNTQEETVEEKRNSRRSSIRGEGGEDGPKEGARRLPPKAGERRALQRQPLGPEPLETPNNLNEYYQNLEKSPREADPDTTTTTTTNERGSGRATMEDKRPVVLHAATQVQGSPRQRVDAVKIHSDPNNQPAKEPEAKPVSAESTESKAKRPKRQIVRRESVSVRGTSSVTRRASTSASFQRQDSLRNKETPHRMTTPRMSSSVPRNRTGGHPAAPTSSRNRSPKERSKSASKEKEGSRDPVRSYHTRVSNASNSNPGQIPGLRSSNVTTAEGAAADTALRRKCVEFTRNFLDNFTTDVEKVTRSILRQTYVESANQRFLEEGIQDLHQFLQQMSQAEQEIPPLYSSEETRKSCHDIRQKATYILRKIKGTYESVKTKPPPCLLKARDAISMRPTSPKKGNRYASLSNESARRSGSGP